MLPRRVHRAGGVDDLGVLGEPVGVVRAEPARSPWVQCHGDWSPAPPINPPVRTDDGRHPHGWRPPSLSGQLSVQRRVVDDERRLERGVLGAGEADRHRLARERRDVERLLACSPVALLRLRVRRQRGRARLDRQLVVRRRGGGLRGVDVQVERQRRAAAGRDRHRLAAACRCGWCRSRPATPSSVPGVRGLAGRAVDHAGGRGPRCGRTGLEAGVAELLAGAAAAATADGEGERRRAADAAAGCRSP